MAPEEGKPYVLQLLGGQHGGEPLVGLSPQMRKARTFAILHQSILQSSQRRPLIIVVENMHWIDPTSEEYLASPVENLAGAAILLLTTYRPGYQPPWLGKSYVTQLALPRLTSRDSLTVVQSVWPSAPHLNRLAPVIVAKAAGNPFFLEELTRAALELGDHHTAMVIPDTVQAVLAARIARLLPADTTPANGLSHRSRGVPTPPLCRARPAGTGFPDHPRPDVGGHSGTGARGRGAHLRPPARALSTAGETSQLFRVLWGLLSFYVVRAELQSAWEVGEQLLCLAQRQHDPALLMVAH